MNSKKQAGKGRKERKGKEGKGREGRREGREGGREGGKKEGRKERKKEHCAFVPFPTVGSLSSGLVAEACP